MRIRRSVAIGLWRGWLALAATALAAFGLVAAQAAWHAIAAHHGKSTAPARLTGYEADNHFPGAALIYAEADAHTPPAPSGATGTVALPPLPVPAATAAAIVAAATGVTPARPFAMTRASATDRGRALQCLADAIYYEAASEPDAGQRAVAQVVLNRVRHPVFPATVCGVVYQGSATHGCQFSYACDGAMARAPSRTGWARAARVAAAALAGYVYAPVGLATHYHTFAVTPAWNRTLVMTDVEGAHFFHRWKGYWGTAAAFRQVYAGGEPLPGPHAPIVAPLPPLLPPITIAAAPVPTPPASIRAAYADTSVPVALPASEDRLPAASTILPQWRNSGKPL